MTSNSDTAPSRRLIWTGLVLVVIGILPLLSMLASTTIAGAAGCQLDESGAHPCMILGTDWGGVLVTMFVAGWLMLVSLPIGAAGLAPR